MNRDFRQQEMSFSGFSEDDIRKLSKPQETTNKTQKASNKASLKKVTFNKSNPNHASRSKNTLNNNNLINSATTVQAQADLPENAKLSMSNKNNVKENETSNNKNSLPPIREGDCEEMNKREAEHLEQTNPEVNPDKKFKDLDEFEARQKLIEEQNRKRKELLAKALADRTKQTQEEAQRLSEIQEEFKKLDAMLSCDVKILRKQIEAVSVEYMECQKRYHKIEKEFLEAKMMMYQKLEKKEMLTEHLCTIIEKNEERKAEKLTELLEKLQVKPPQDTEISENDSKAANNSTT